MRSFIYAAGAWIVITLLVVLLIDKMMMPLIAGQFKEKVVVGDYIGEDPEIIKKDLEKKKLILVIDTVAEFSPDIPAGNIVNQRPLPNTEVKEGRRVWFTISKGLNSVTIPKLKGKTKRQGEITLQQLGLRLKKIVNISNSSIPAGTIIKTNPNPGTVLAVNESVTLYVSKGGGKPRLGRYIGMSYSKVKGVLNKSGLKLGKVKFKTDAGSLPNTVINQNPRAGTPIKNGMPVHLVVSIH